MHREPEVAGELDKAETASSEAPARGRHAGVSGAAIPVGLAGIDVEDAEKVVTLHAP